MLEIIRFYQCSLTEVLIYETVLLKKWGPVILLILAHVRYQISKNFNTVDTIKTSLLELSCLGGLDYSEFHVFVGWQQ